MTLDWIVGAALLAVSVMLPVLARWRFRTRVRTLLLMALVRGPAPAGEIASRVQERHGLVITEGVLHPTLADLVEEGLLADFDAGGRTRRLYVLTEEGRALIEARRGAT